MTADAADMWAVVPSGAAALFRWNAVAGSDVLLAMSNSGERPHHLPSEYFAALLQLAEDVTSELDALPHQIAAAEALKRSIQSLERGYSATKFEVVKLRYAKLLKSLEAGCSFGSGSAFPFEPLTRPRAIVAEPHDLAKLAAAFDAAWMGVNSVHTIGKQPQKRARTRLAEIIIELWNEDPEQPLGARAVERFLSMEMEPDGP